MNSKEIYKLHRKIKNWECICLYTTGNDLIITYYSDDKYKYLHPECDEQLLNIMQDYSNN